MVLAIGLVVDDAIVVVENIHRHLEEGKSPVQASLEGAREIVGPVISMTITLAAVYAPIGFLSGLTGSLFREFAFTLAGSVIVSGVIALTLSPMMCSVLLKQEEPSWFGKKVDKVLAPPRAGTAASSIVRWTIVRSPHCSPWSSSGLSASCICTRRRNWPLKKIRASCLP